MTHPVPRLPAVFVASSTEGLSVARALHESLDTDCDVTLWTQGVFAPSSTVLSDLLVKVKQFDFALFVFSPDDCLELRGSQLRAVRDNVIFEFGLFVGALGLSQCMYIVPRGVKDLRLPTDILGLTPLEYRTDRGDSNLLAALEPACNKVRRALALWLSHRSHPPADGSAAEDGSTPAVELPTLNRYLTLWNAAPLASDRERLRQGVSWDPYDDHFPREAVLRIFLFLNSLADATLCGRIDEAAARQAFGKALISFWPFAATSLAPPNHGDDYWEPLPRIAELYLRWRP